MVSKGQPFVTPVPALRSIVASSRFKEPRGEVGLLVRSRTLPSQENGSGILSANHNLANKATLHGADRSGLASKATLHGANRIGLASEAALHGDDRSGFASEATLHGDDRFGLASEATLHGAHRFGLASEAALHERRAFTAPHSGTELALPCSA
jgi:hypothetical protein